MGKLIVQCACGKRYSVAEEARGKKVVCSACQRRFVVPAAPAPQPAEVGLASDALGDDFAAFLDANLPAPGSPSAAAEPDPPRPKADPVARERAALEAELSELRDQMKEDFLLGHNVRQARDRVNARIEQARANAPAETRQAPGLTGVAYFLGYFSGVGGVLAHMFLSTIWPSRTTRAEVSVGQAEMAGLDAAAQYGRRRLVSAQARSNALQALISKEAAWSARLARSFGGSVCGAATTLALVALALAVNVVQPLVAILFLGIAIYGGTRVRRELAPLDYALQDYPHLAARFGPRRINPLGSAVIALAAILVTAATIGWVGLTTYQWGRGLVSSPPAPQQAPQNDSAADNASSRREDPLEAAGAEAPPNNVSEP